MKVDSACAESIGHELHAWNPERVKQLKLKFYAYPEVKALPGGARSIFVDCLADKVVAKFPGGVTKENEKALIGLVNKAGHECAITAIEKYTKPVAKEKQKLPNARDTVSAN